MVLVVCYDYKDIDLSSCLYYEEKLRRRARIEAYKVSLE